MCALCRLLCRIVNAAADAGQAQAASTAAGASGSPHVVNCCGVGARGQQHLADRGGVALRGGGEVQRGRAAAGWGKMKRRIIKHDAMAFPANDLALAGEGLTKYNTQ